METNTVIEFLKTLPENSGQVVELDTATGIKQFHFMWFKDEKTIHLKPVDNINTLPIPEKFWDKIRLVF